MSPGPHCIKVVLTARRKWGIEGRIVSVEVRGNLPNPWDLARRLEARLLMKAKVAKVRPYCYSPDFELLADALIPIGSSFPPHIPKGSDVT